MRDIETLQNLQDIIENLANGINVFTGELANEGDIINDVKIVRGLFTVNEILKELIAQPAPKKAKKAKKATFVYNEELINKVIISPRAISLSEIIGNIKAAYNRECKLTYNNLADMLYSEGILIENTDKGPKLKASEQAKQFGIWSEILHHTNGDKLHTYYDECGQKYVLKLLKEYFSV